jgi:lincosamide nucleotidyltransferase A/C/D/E
LTRATAEDVIELFSGLRAERVRVWVDGGWGIDAPLGRHIDALLGRQTRRHKDFDDIVLFEDRQVLTRLLEGRGFALKLIWEEKRWAPSSELLAPIGRSRPAVEATG